MFPCSSVKSHQVKKKQKINKIRKQKKEKGKLPKCNIIMGKIIGELSLSQNHSLLLFVLGLLVGVFSWLGREE